MFGLYIHIPFCKKKCFYCDFPSLGLSENKIIYPPLDFLRLYSSAVIKEMYRYQGNRIFSIYIGGGTPSILPPSLMEDILKSIFKIFNCDSLCEFTIEVNPESVNIEKLKIYKEFGCNRLSIGVQSFDNKELAFLGRVHNLEQSLEVINLAKKANFESINIDLIYGLPKQSFISWKSNLKKALMFEPEHISLYPLVIESDTELDRLGINIDEDLQADMYEYSIDLLSKHGYKHYEISNWARDGFECKHNMLYWSKKEYIGLGSSAVSYIKNKRFKNEESPYRYIDLIFNNMSPISDIEDIDEDKEISEYIILGLRKSEGIPLIPLIEQRFKNEIEEGIHNGLLKRTNNRLKLTRNGLLLANCVMQKFV